ncbi:hypothetical protein SPBR_09220 [Sporothrix brasiliensis 5110]|uniref:DUF2470 domain-containing protein n=1 Tax=Sporothrix brasiliensis 5110 TaxID=1398154 RepID=A0A0C2IZ15_9PEZI|nr:uncharacterized protein SPBR_09220 [Sporothrix brasiliensis 5110]KIH94356.1 hypothetical protein SPBR_09220 [Sporothrix brasiliensis 5110]
MASIDDKSKQATMAHMNREHTLDLGLYLRFVNGLSAKQLTAEGAPELVDIDLNALYIRTATTGTVHVVPFTPPMTSWDDRRQRIIALAMDARKAFGVPLPEHNARPSSASTASSSSSPPTGSPAAATNEPVSFQLPGVVQFLVMFGVVLYFVLCGLMYTGRDETTSNTWARVLGAVGVTERNFIFGGADGFRLMLHLTAVPILAIHIAEAWWMTRTRLASRGMKVLSQDGLLWTGLTFLIGFGSFLHFDRLARQQARAAAGVSKQM